MFKCLKPSAHSTIFVAEDEDFVAGEENLLCAGNKHQQFLSLTTIFNIKHTRNHFSSLITKDKIFVASNKNRAVRARLTAILAIVGLLFRIAL